jgi:hypothetical protein
MVIAQLTLHHQKNIFKREKEKNHQENIYAKNIYHCKEKLKTYGHRPILLKGGQYRRNGGSHSPE